MGLCFSHATPPQTLCQHLTTALLHLSTAALLHLSTSELLLLPIAELLHLSTAELLLSAQGPGLIPFLVFSVASALPQQFEVFLSATPSLTMSSLLQ